MRIRAPFLPSSLMRRGVWAQVGGFPPFRAGEDLIFMEAIERAGCRIAYAPDAVARWELAPTWRATFRRFASYSRHNLVAGRARQWHYGVTRLYGLAGACLGLAVLHDPLWALVPLAGVAARTGRIVYRKRDGFAFQDVFRPRRLAFVTALLLLLDAATAWGAIVWAWRDRRCWAAAPPPAAQGTPER